MSAIFKWLELWCYKKPLAWFVNKEVVSTKTIDVPAQISAPEQIAKVLNKDEQSELEGKAEKIEADSYERLDRGWALQIGFPQYFVKHYIPCVNCDVKKDWWCWGDDAHHASCKDISRLKLARAFEYEDGTRKEFSGWLCYACERRFVGNWKKLIGLPERDFLIQS